MVRLVFIFIITGSLVLFASDIDLNASKGTDQSVIASLSPAKAQLDVWNNAKIEISFNVPIDASSVQKNNVKLVHLSSRTNDHIDGTISYDKYDNKVVFVPSALLPMGTYEVEIKSLKPTKEHQNEQIKEIKYRFYVPEVINDHQLPPEPDPTVNNSTLLGIDVNNNGVRDDVERYLLNKYRNHHHIVIEMALQHARAFQIVIANPQDAKNTYHFINDAQDCNFYFQDDAEEFGDPVLIDHEIFNNAFKNIQLNTPTRIKAYLEYDRLLSGDIYPLTPIQEQKAKCDFDVDTLLGKER